MGDGQKFLTAGQDGLVKVSKSTAVDTHNKEYIAVLPDGKKAEDR